MFDHQDMLFMEKYRKKSNRKQDWDYSSCAIYHITFCTYRHVEHFGTILNSQMTLSKIGKIVNEEIIKTFKVRNNLKLHDYVVMPNHIHLLFEILENVETPRWGVSPQKETQKPGVMDISDTKLTVNFHKPEIASLRWKANSIGSVVNQIKSISTKRINKIPILFAWQSRYYDEIIKSEQQYWATRKYIRDNAKNWQSEKD